MLKLQRKGIHLSVETARYPKSLKFSWVLTLMLIFKPNTFKSYYVRLCPKLNTQEALENFVFPDEIKRKLMRMSKLVNIFYVP